MQQPEDADSSIQRLEQRVRSGPPTEALISELEQQCAGLRTQRDAARAGNSPNPAGGAAVGGALGFLVGGPLGALVGAAIGAVVGSGSGGGRDDLRTRWSWRLTRAEGLLAEARRLTQPPPVAPAPNPVPRPPNPTPAGLPQARIVALAGVTHDGRQETIALTQTGEAVRIVRRPHNPYDASAIEVLREGGASLGWLQRDVAAQYAPWMDAGRPLYGRIAAIVGGHAPGMNYGVRVEVRTDRMPAAPARSQPAGGRQDHRPPAGAGAGSAAARLRGPYRFAGAGPGARAPLVDGGAPAAGPAAAVAGLGVQHAAFGHGRIERLEGSAEHPVAVVRFAQGDVRRILIGAGVLATLDGRTVMPPMPPRASRRPYSTAGAYYPTVVDSSDDGGGGDSLPGAARGWEAEGYFCEHEPDEDYRSSTGDVEFDDADDMY